LYRDPQPGSEPGGENVGGDDEVISLRRLVYDKGSNVTERHVFENNHDDTNGIDLEDNDDYVRRTVFSW
jgi:hypothetical protein